MEKINRSAFLKQSLRISALVALGQLHTSFAAQAAHENNSNRLNAADDLLTRLATANDQQVARLLQSDLDKSVFSRKTGYDFAALAASYCFTGSTYHHSPLIVPALEKLVTLLLSAQAEDGTVNIGNLESPPDTAFLLEPLSAGAYLLAKEPAPEVRNINGNIKKFILKAGDALTTGGVHTPNHRWVICAALARLNVLYPNQQYLNRIQDWLGEGIFIDADGNFPERSRNYAVVEDNSLITMGRLLNQPSFFEPAAKNLDLTYYYMEPDGDLVTTDSRRQDKYTGKSIVSYYLHYRYLAIRNNNSNFAAIARLIEQMKGFEEEIVDRSLFHFLENPLLQKELPAGTPPPVNYEKLIATSSLLRIRRGNTTTTLFGGVDWPLIIASGRSESPNFYAFRKGNAVLKYLRLSANFFSTGYFYSEGIKKNGNKYVLYKKLEVPYYQPLPKNLRKPDGDYKLSPSTDGRFWNKMDFDNRPVSNVKTLETTVSFTATEAANELHFDITGQAGVQITIELCFAAGGQLSGVTEAGNDNSFFSEAIGKYQFQGDTIQFGPGAVGHKMITNLEGERYSTHFGTLRTEGMHVYITGVTPFKHTLTFS